MKLVRGTTIALLAATGIAAAVLAGSVGVGAQTANDATIDLTVRYPDGSIVDDRGVCASYLFGDPGGIEGIFAGSEGATASLPVVSGARIAIRIGGNCETATDGLNTQVWHNGLPVVGFRSVETGVIDHQLLIVEPGSNVVDVTVGEVRFAGTVSGTSPAQPSSCQVTAVGASNLTGEPEVAHYSTSPDADGSWEIWAPPGSYRFESSCFLRSAFEAWPNVSEMSAATEITLAHGQERTGINFDLSDRFDETTGANLFLQFDATDGATPKCVEAYDAADLTLVRTGFSRSVSTPDDGNYRVRVWDCFGLGFDEQWYPAGASAQGGPSIAVAGQGEITIVPSPLTGNGFNECNGQPITIRGTTGDDSLVGTAGPDVISGLSGNDEVTGLGGNDVVCGGDGNDRIAGNAGADWIDGGAGNDWVGAGWGDDTVFGGDGDDFIRSFRHDDTVDGGPGNDVIRGGWGNDVLRGGDGNDTIRAYFGADMIFGDAGNDVLVGEGGPDFIVGGAGPADLLIGGAGTQDTCNDVGADTRFRGCERLNE